MAFGRVKHSKKKMSARYYEREHAGKSQVRRFFSVNIAISRGSRPTNTGRVHGFWAGACFGGAKAKIRFNKCGPEEFGRTPTIAAKKALVALGRSRDVK